MRFLIICATRTLSLFRPEELKESMALSNVNFFAKIKAHNKVLLTDNFPAALQNYLRERRYTETIALLRLSIFSKD